MTAMYPPVLGYGDIDMESFESYYSRWPADLASIPRPIVEQWIHRHWSCFRDRWVSLQPHTWSYRLAAMTSAQVLAIDHVGKWIEELDAEGVEYVTGAPRSRTPLAQKMLARGTFAEPIIVTEGAGHVTCPRSGEQRMKVPLQLIEGHTRLAIIRGMINSGHPNLAAEHLVWLVRIPGG